VCAPRKSKRERCSSSRQGSTTARSRAGSEYPARRSAAILRGLIWSDGCSFINRHAKYEDLCFAFSNRSTDLLDLFAGLCDRLDLPYRRYEPRLEGARMRVGQVRINRREPAARILEHVGLKR
jgi:hypothetical protein